MHTGWRIAVVELTLGLKKNKDQHLAPHFPQKKKQVNIALLKLWNGRYDLDDKTPGEHAMSI